VVKVRYNHDGAPAFLEEVAGRIRVYFEEPVNAITPGQAAVFYDGQDVLGGGWIERHVIGEIPLPFASEAAAV
jgi:tRNA-specific 2-thiouridylase